MGKTEIVKQWSDVIMDVLSQSKKPMRYDQIADIIVEQKLRPANKLGATPANTVNVVLRNKLSDKVICLSPGVYVLKEYFDKDLPFSGVIEDATEDGEKDIQDSLITAYGRFWSRALWEENEKRLFGTSIKTKNAPSVDFTKNKGIYLLHKGYEVIYVGQARVLNNRLNDHTIDDKRCRWDSFSWFSISPIKNGIDEEDEIKAKKVTKEIEERAILDTLEALLIETLGPSRNKKVGNDFDGREFEQITAAYYLKNKA